MLYDVPQSKTEQWKWFRPRLSEWLELCKQYEEKILNGGATFLYRDFAKAFGYAPEFREVKENNFRNVINSDISLLDPYRVNGKRVIVGFDGWSKDGRRLITVSCIHSQKADVSELKLFKDNCGGDNCKGNDEINLNNNTVVDGPFLEIKQVENKEFKVAESSLDLDKLPEKYKKQLEQKLHEGEDEKKEQTDSTTESI